MKRIFDISLSILLIILFFPLMLVIGIFIVLDTPGGIIYKQKRIGYEGKIFEMYKFRSMFANRAEQGAYYTDENDKRITKVGRFIRRTSLDELPQLFNVLKGDMSLVGPRPDVPEQSSLYTEDEWRLRNSVRPGITGLQQATLRSSSTEEQRKSLDFEYIKRRSILFDVYVLWLTILQVFTKGGN